MDRPLRFSAAALLVAILVPALGIVAGARAQPPLLTTFDPSSIPGRVDKPLPHLDAALGDLAAQWRVDPAQARREASGRGLTLRDGFVQVSVLMQDPPAADRARERIAALGGEVTARFGRMLDAWIPVGRLATLSRIPRVSLVHQPVPPIPLDQPGVSSVAEKAGTYLTQGVTASNASTWQAAGLTGAGSSVAVIDSFQDAQTAVNLGELPDPTFCYPDCGSLDTSSRHGTACAEIIHDMAPGASITLSSVGTSTELAQRITQLAAEGADVISVSLGFVAPVPGDGTGAMADAIATARTSYDALYVGAGGNHADFHWDGPWSDPEGDDAHNFSGTTEVNILAGGGAIPAGTPLSAYLRWNDWPASDQDFDLYLLYWTGTAWDIAAGSTNVQSGTQPPWEFVSTLAPFTTAYGLVVIKYSATTSPVLDLMSWSQQRLTVQQPERSLLEPATSSDSLTAAAIDVGTFALESYSSRGPAHGLGGALSGGHALPRLSAFANVDTWSYGSGVFNGTSSATPHIAGAAALVRGADPTLAAGETQSFLEGRAVDQGSAGYDHAHGHGRLWLGAVPTWDLSVSRAGSGSGTVTSTPTGISCGGDCVHDYAHGTLVELTVSAASGSEFIGWSGDGDCADGEVAMTADRSCTATFEPLPSHLLSVSTTGTGSGTVTSSPGGISCGGDCSESYPQGTAVLLSGTPALGSEITSWSGDADCTDGLVQMAAATSCVATFNACSTQSEVTLESASITGAHLETACNSLHVGPGVTVTATGDLTLQAGNSVVFESGFAVDSGGGLTVITGQPSP